MPGPLNAVNTLRAENDDKLARTLENLADGPVKILSESLTGLTSALEGMVGIVGQFVQALSPSTMAEFGRALDGLKATIGSAFLPFVQVMSGVTREIAGVLLPAMQRLTPVVKSLSETVANTLLSAVKGFTTVLLAITPVIEIVAHAAQELSAIFLDAASVVTVFVQTIVDVVTAMLGKVDFRDTFKAFYDIIRQTTRALVTFAATVAVFAGLAKFVNQFSEGLAAEARARDARAGGLLGAASNPQTTDIASIMRQAQQSAFIAAGGGTGREKSDTQWLAELSADLKKISGENKSLKEALNDWWTNEVMGGEKSLFAAVLRLFRDLKGRIERFFDRFR